MTARALARDGTWRRLVTDPLSGALLDVGRTRYRPPADLDELVRLRDGACVRPGCSVPSHACDLDHTVPFGEPDAPFGAPGASGGSSAPFGAPDVTFAGDSMVREADGPGGSSRDEAPAERRGDASAGRAPGATAHGNLGALCRTDHRLKTHAGFRLEQVAPGVFVWITPTGHHYGHTPRGPAEPVVTDTLADSAASGPDDVDADRRRPHDTGDDPPPF